MNNEWTSLEWRRRYNRLEGLWVLNVAAIVLRPAGLHRPDRWRPPGGAGGGLRPARGGRAGGVHRAAHPVGAPGPHQGRRRAARGAEAAAAARREPPAEDPAARVSRPVPDYMMAPTRSILILHPANP